ncbi:MAG: hypothetical protein R8M45_05690 [Ghiorsea sp.]
MKAKYVEITVTRDAHAAIGKTVMEHEVAILEEIYGEVSREAELDDVREVDPAEEYARLERIYGEEKESSDPFVRVVYGRFNDGRFAEKLQANAESAGGNVAVADILDLSITKATEALAGLDKDTLDVLLEQEYAGKTRQGMIDAIENAIEALA